MEKLKPGFVWHVKTYDRCNNLTAEQKFVNLMPIEGLNYLLNTAFKEGVQYASFHVGLYESTYTPVPSDLMASFPSAAVELTAYTSANRPALTFGTVSGGNLDNFANITEFTGTTDGKKAQGGFICTAAAKGGTTGPLLSAVKFPTPQNLNSGGRIEVAAVFQFVSV